MLTNLTAAGLAILKIENITSLKVDKMRLTYSSAYKRIQVESVLAVGVCLGFVIHSLP
jgi:hypothetical protein